MTSPLDAVDPDTRSILDRYSFDRRSFETLQHNVATGTLSERSNVVAGGIAPPPFDAIRRLPESGSTAYAEAFERGLTAIRSGQVAMAVLNGGMATRFGGAVKGIVEALNGRSFLEWKLLEAERVAQAAGGEVPCIVMNSFATDQPTRDFLDTLDETLSEPLLFTQSVSLRLNRDGSLFLDEAGRASPYAPGHGDFPSSLLRTGTLAALRARGVQQVMLSNVDNLGARVDPLVAGMHLLAGRPMTVEVTPKAAGDAGGAPAMVDGRVIVVEGFRFPPGFDQDSIPVFNTNSFVFDLDALEADVPLTWFYVEKGVAGRTVVQLERLVNELSSFMPTTYLEVPREGPRGRFFPVKQPEDLEAVRPRLREMLETGLT
jgi:UTP--glucose-1-phosphate uridylyltransferase